MIKSNFYISMLSILIISMSLSGKAYSEDLGQRVLPEKAFPIRLSNRDINRVVCPGEIKDISYSQEKKVIVKVVDNNAYIKFQITKNPDFGYEEDEELIYSETATEFYITCDGNVYTIIAEPVDISAQTVRLSGGRKKNIKKNLAMFKGMAFEHKAVELIQAAYTENIPESFSIEKINKQITMSDFNLTLIRKVSIDGEGLMVKEFLVSLKGREDEFERLDLEEKDFLKSNITRNPLAVSIYPLVIQSGQRARVFIVERTDGVL